MSELNDLFLARDYSKIIEETEGKEDGEALFYRASALLALGEKEKAMGIFESKRKALFAYNPLATIKNDMKLRVYLEEFDEAYEDLREFEEYPYVSQEVEEILRSIPRYLREKERESVGKRPLSVEEAKKRLRERKSDMDVLSTLEAISSIAVDPFLDEIKSLLLSSVNSSVKTYALLLLLNCGYDEEIVMIKDNKRYQLIPKNINPPFVGPLFKAVKEEISALSKDPSVNEVAYALWSDYVLSLFPENAFEGTNAKEISEVFYVLALEYLRRDDIESLLSERGIKEEELIRQKEKVSKALSSLSPIKG